MLSETKGWLAARGAHRVLHQAACVVIAYFLMIEPGFLSAGAKTLNVADYPNIADTINHASTGDTVYIPNGIYYIATPSHPNPASFSRVKAKAA